jgi:hypothetical protein
MSNPIRVEQMERERDFYRLQGAASEREKIYALIRRYADEDYPRDLDETLEISLAAIANGALAAGHDYGASDERTRIVGLLMQLPVSAELWSVILDLKGERNA